VWVKVLGSRKKKTLVRSEGRGWGGGQLQVKVTVLQREMGGEKRETISLPHFGIFAKGIAFDLIIGEIKRRDRRWEKVGKKKWNHI